MIDFPTSSAPPLNLAVDPAARAALNGIPAIDFRSNFALAVAAGRGMPGMLRDVVALRFGPGRLTSNEYYYYRLWEPGVSDDAKRRVIGKVAQHAMHLACNKPDWQAAASDKLLFHSIMTGAGLPVPELLAIAHTSRSLPGVLSVRTQDDLMWFLRDSDNYPLFAKPIGGKYSLAVLSADRVAGETMTLRGAPTSATVYDAACALAGGEDGFVIQRRLEPAPEIAAAFGARLWSIRLLVLLTPDGPVLHRATAKIPTGTNPADNYWRRGNLLAALDPETGQIARVVTGAAETFKTVTQHPDTGADLIDVTIPRWSDTVDLVMTAAPLLPGIGTQSWDIAVAEAGPVILEVNFGGDLNLSQLASGYGTLDETFRQHLARHGYKHAKG
jgi:hypothetical protein